MLISFIHILTFLHFILNFLPMELCVIISVALLFTLGANKFDNRYRLCLLITSNSSGF